MRKITIWMFQNSILNRKNQNLGAKKDLFRRKLRQTAEISKSYSKSKNNSSQSDNRAKSYGLSKFSKLKTHCSCHVSKSRPRGRDFLPRQQIALMWTRFPVRTLTSRWRGRDLLTHPLTSRYVDAISGKMAHSGK